MQVIIKDNNTNAWKCPSCEGDGNVNQVSGQREMSKDGRWAYILWQCDDCGTRWFTQVSTLDTQPDQPDMAGEDGT